MKKTLFALAVMVLLSGAAHAREGNEDSATSSNAAVDALVQKEESKFLNGDSEKERKRKLAKLKKEYELQQRKERWSNLTPDKKKSAELKRKIAALGQGGTFDENDLPKATREQIQKLTPEDKESSKRDVLKTWTQLSADQKYFIKRDAKEKWNTLTEEEKDQFKAILAFDGDKTTVNTVKPVVSRPLVSVSKPPVANTYFEDGVALGRYKKSNFIADQSLNSGDGTASGYSYSMFGPGGIRR